MTTKCSVRDSKPRFLFIIMLVLLIIRWWLATTPGYPPDINTYTSWGLCAGIRGIETIYEDDLTMDYPPLYGYLTAPAGFIYHKFVYPQELEAARTQQAGQSGEFVPPSSRDSVKLRMMIKTPPLIFDILLAIILAMLVNRFGLWRGRSSWLGWAPALIYLCHPAILFESGYWGQPDSVENFFIILALTLILLRKPEYGWAAAALGLLMKPLAAPFYPLFALATIQCCGWRRLFTGGAVGLATFFAGFLPFMLTGRGIHAFRKVFLDIDVMPYTSVNGHNLWWLLGPWEPASSPLIGPISPRMIGYSLFGTAILLVLWWVWKMDQHRPPAAKDNPSSLDHLSHWYIGGAAIAYGFFTFSTHMHENHLVPALPFLIVLAGRNRRWAALMIISGICMGINMLTHDLHIAADLFADAGGISSYWAYDIDWYLKAYPGVIDRLPYLSRLEMGMAYTNASVVVISCGFLIWTMVRILRQRLSKTENSLDS